MMRRSNGITNNDSNLHYINSFSIDREVEVMAGLSRNPRAVKPGGNIASIDLTRKISRWAQIDLTEPKKVQKRVDQYFNLMAEHDSKPLVSGLAQALGIDRYQLYRITHDIAGTDKATHIPKECKDIIKEAYMSLEVAFEYNFTNGNINPVTGIFLAKNHFGYTDQKELVLAPKNTLGDVEDQAAIEKRLLASIVKD